MTGSTTVRSIFLAVIALGLGFCGAALAQATADPGSINLHAIGKPFAVFAVSAFIGQIGHAIKKWYKGETVSTPWEWFFSDHGKNTVAAIGASLSAAASTALLHGLDGVAPAMVVYTGFVSGIAADSTFNKGAPSAR